jgi:hypothetical protein
LYHSAIPCSGASWTGSWDVFHSCQQRGDFLVGWLVFSLLP